MTAHYYEAVAELSPDHCLHLQLPPEIPAGPVRVTIIYGRAAPATGQDIKNLLAAMPDVGEDTDFARPRDLGREVQEWDS
ncbi:hypothetical protein [Methylovulum psychrotolerans]|uniref:Uncharacterized protein n=1 Tax=Methylovulum psychrotolerans TaxID=1704499 RepID=A0A1Z4C172_9GAMM|nr:hypothetical protein [Methylovulum psychrotolerans]ASF47287.1 hypothetical protein CEK71_15090 [Methylovulum psychrotolerans]